MTYTLGNASAIGTGNTFPALTFWLQSTVGLPQPGGRARHIGGRARRGSATVDVTITATPWSEEDKTLTVAAHVHRRNNQKYRVPYAGFIGDYQSLRILDAGAAGIFPTIGRTHRSRLCDRSYTGPHAGRGGCDVHHDGRQRRRTSWRTSPTRCARSGSSSSRPRRTSVSARFCGTSTANGTAVAPARRTTSTATCTCRSRSTGP